jgi:hypothetical protein
VSDDDSCRTLPVGIDDPRAALADRGYLLVSDQLIGLPKNFRQTFLDTYFNAGVLRHDDGDWPADRKRARDVIRYQWRDGDLDLQEHETITITNRAGIPGKRDHQRVRVLEDPLGEQFVRTLLSLVPLDRRQADGTSGINLFRTFTDVVTKPHRDDEEFIIIYVLDRIGDGAVSYLYQAGGDSVAVQPVFQHQLNPGEILMFDDERFIHDVSELKAREDGQAQRDVLVCTVDYPSTYLSEAATLSAEGLLVGSG